MEIEQIERTDLERVKNNLEFIEKVKRGEIENKVTHSLYEFWKAGVMKEAKELGII